MKLIPVGISITTLAITLGEAILYYNIGRSGKLWGRELVALPEWKTVGFLALWALGLTVVTGLATDILRSLVD